MKRRTLLRTSATALGGSAATLAVVSAGSDDARAETALTLDVVGDSAEMGADASLAAVTLALTTEWAYELPESASPQTVVVEIAAGADGDEPVVADSAESAQLFTTAEGEESFDVDLLGTDALSADDVSTDGTTDVIVEARLRVEDGDGEALARETASDTATLEVSREGLDASEYGSVGGSGSLTIETE
ncbi:hypothetical protein DQW50_16215 [Halorubrum sp. 48-1-W]|uniref:hypothetical protein n=1 Tax=Halorubrum sp. 48-1-W TaxID=2249761 RepID=UPI000DCD4C4B|nr:hypothetical protein [Halorubrum sp. 48-1-W]RAW44068.1 hypothetical protein DQW50_16215 [Halorubrum sp. 48-1-W]